MAKTPESPARAAKPLDLNDAALVLFDAAPAPLNDILREVCGSVGIQPWQLILGHLMKADQRAEIHAPLLMDEWTADSPTPAAQKTGQCQCCRRVMTRDKNAAFCCNYCGSGRYQQDQQHHPDCEFYIAPKRHLTLPNQPQRLPPVPPTDAAERQEFEAAAYQQHLKDVTVAEASPGGLPPLPDDLMADPRRAWAGSKR